MNRVEKIRDLVQGSDWEGYEKIREHLKFLLSLLDEKEKEIGRLRWMIDYAMDAPGVYESRKVLKDALDGVAGAINYHEIKGEREKLRAIIKDLVGMGESAESIVRMLQTKINGDCMMTQGMIEAEMFLRNLIQVFDRAKEE